jgi:hypothetical protein
MAQLIWESNSRNQIAVLVKEFRIANSSKNKYNPDPTRAVRFGDPTYDEMMVGVVEYTVDGKSVKASTAMNK